MISRVAEHCFWMSRYLERAENVARVLDVNQTLLLDFAAPIEHQWKPLLIISGIHDFAEPGKAEAVQHHMTWESENASSIASSLTSARENARTIREVISTEMWERINYYYLWLNGPRAHAMYDQDRHGFYSQIKRINALLFGIAEGTMAHGEAWDFLRLGKYLERAAQTARILDVKYHMLLPTPDLVNTPIDNAHWVAILKSCSGYEPFHKQRQSFEQGTTIADTVSALQALALAQGFTVDVLDGLTVDHGTWWYNVRPSNTEPLLRLNVEARSSADCTQRIAEVTAMIMKVQEN